MFKKTITQLFILIIVIGAVFLANGLIFNWLNLVQAGVDDNSSGYAWSENIGWVSFNNTTGGGSDYGVQIDPSTGYLSGYAWSEHIGWISFNRTDIGTGNPPAAPFNDGSSPIAQYDKNTDQITGWMRVLANGGGWDGWIRFENASIDINGDWHGWAWSDMVVGWLSFNSAEGGGSSYKVSSVGVVNSPPTVSGLSVSAGDSATYCGVSANHYFSWTYSDLDVDDQNSFQFQVDNNSDFSSPEIDRDYPGLSNPSPTVNNQIATLVSELAYNTIYYWRVKVYDSQGLDSGWICYGGDCPGTAFTTELHQYPDIDFDWSPQGPSIGEDVVFEDLSNCYDADSNCDSWSWDFNEDSIEDSSEQDPTTQFTSTGDKQVTLQATDSDGYSCSRDKTVDVQSLLPGWKEK